MAKHCGIEFKDVLLAELREIRDSRKHRDQPAGMAARHGSGLAALDPRSSPGANEIYRSAADMELLGLAFSGGGIRSATFNLGILQGLARRGLLPRFDYLSTVSGGGYIGSWLTTWIKRAQEGMEDEKGVAVKKDVNDVAEALAGDYPTQDEAEAAPIQFLRRYSNYLTPKLGLFSGDTLAAISIFTRNLLLNLLILIPALAAGLLLPRIARLCMDGLWPEGSGATPGYYSLRLGGLFLLMAVIMITVNLWRLRKGAPRQREACPFYAQPWAVKVFLVAPVVTAAWLLGPWLLSSMAGAGLDPCGIFPCREMSRWTQTDKTAWSMPAALGLLSLTGILLVGVVAGRGFAALRAEWTSRVGGWLLGCAVAWVVFCTIALYSVEYWKAAAHWERAGPWTGFWKTKEFWTGVITLLLGGGASGVVAGSTSSSLHTQVSKSVRNLAIQLSPYVLVAAVLTALALGAERIFPAADWISAWTLTLLAPALGLLALLLSWRIDVNAFSMHYFYRNRLARCYLGSSDPHRQPDPFTGFVPGGHTLRISDLLVDPPENGDIYRAAGKWQAPYYGPYQLVNTTINLVHGKQLAWQKRKAASFTLAPLYSGYFMDENCLGAFRPTRDYQGGMSLGTAMAISGAALTPNMGYHSSPPVAFLMSVLNVRLGWWLGNTRVDSAWYKPGPPLGLFYLLCELFGVTDSERDYVYLSDGGHFENLGIYELVRRRCRYIIACDATADPHLGFGSLGNAIEKCRTDFGIDIEINVDAIRRSETTSYSKAHCAFGRIRYDRLNSQGPRHPVGTLLYIKASLSGEEPADVTHYAEEHRLFPHQTTADQNFDESQFESYRALGEHVAQSVLDRHSSEQELRAASTEEIFVRLRQAWYPPSKAVADHFTTHAATMARIYEQLRTRDELGFLSAQVYPEWDFLVARLRGAKPAAEADATAVGARDAADQQAQKPAGGGSGVAANASTPPAASAAPLGSSNDDCAEINRDFPSDCEQMRAGFFLCNQVIQLMESVYLDLNLEEEYAHPDNYGWMNFFRHWSWSAMFRAAWAVCACNYGARFQRFCQSQLDLELGKITIDPPKHLPNAIARKEDLTALGVSIYEAESVCKGLRREECSNSGGYSTCLLQLEVDLTADNEPLIFQFGYALIDAKKGLRLYRVRDHLRNMGLGREALVELVMQGRVEELNAAIVPAPGPDEDARARFQRLFDSAKIEAEHRIRQAGRR
jgi:Patatin-like phospholipase